MYTGKEFEGERSDNIAKNLVIGVLSKVVTLFMVFLSRTVFIKTLGAEYLGVNGLYTNILTLLSLAELGLGNVLAFSLYLPLKEGREETISALLSFYKKIYRILAVVVFGVGLLFVPFLQYIVRSELSNHDVIIFYIIYLLDSAISYLAIYKSTLFRADQNQRVIEVFTTTSKVIVALAQIVVLLLFKNFIFYLSLQIVGTAIQNILISVYADKAYPFVQKMKTSMISTTQRVAIIENVKSTFIYKIGQTIVNYTDNILISIMIGTVYVGYYSNYSLIVAQVSSFISITTTAIIASIGNLAADGNKERANVAFKNLLYFYQIISGFSSLCFLFLLNGFINLWIGSEYLLTNKDVVAIVMSFYIQNIINPVWMYREAYGLFKEIKYVMLCTAVANILFSIVLGKIWGIGGIIIATGLARICTTVWYEPKILYSKIFSKNPKEYYFKQLKYIFLVAINLLIDSFVFTKIKFEPFTDLIFRFFLIAILFGITNAIVYRKTNEFQYLKKQILYYSHKLINVHV